MATDSTQRDNSTAAFLFAVFAIACVAAFLFFRGNDVGQLSRLVGNFWIGGFGGSGVIDVLVGLAAAAAIGMSWVGLGGVILRVTPVVIEAGKPMILAIRAGLGSAVWSVLWFFFGIAGLYNSTTALVCVGLGLFVFFAFGGWKSRRPDTNGALSITFVALIGTILLLSLVSAVAPPVAKDSLLYHFALPKIFVHQHSNAMVDGNIASYLSLGTEMHYVWAMLAAKEAAAGAVGYLFLPILIMTVARWAEELGISRVWALIASAMVAAVPTVYHVASSGYIDLSLALYVTLATYSLTRWWADRQWGWAILIAIFLGGALSVKLSAVFVFAAFALIVLLRSRENPIARNPESVALSLKGPAMALKTGFGALLLAGLIASPWYIRTWMATGSPVFPFYMSIWPAKANGWDVERSNLFQAMNSQYGGTDENKLNYLTAPIRASVAAQPELPANYDGVLGVAFLIGLPLLVWALWKLRMPVEIQIIAGVAGILYLFWLFSSEQLRYLLPILPMLAIGIAASAERIGGRVAKMAQCGLLAACVCGLLTAFAWFCQKAPLGVVFGGETRDEYLARNLDYYPYYKTINSETAPEDKVWLINMRRDTYNIERPVVSDYLFEDRTLRDMVWHSRNVEELRAKAAALDVQYVLARHDFLFDYDRSTLVDDSKPRAENEAKLAMAKSFLLDPTRVVREDDKFSLVKVF